MPASSSASEDEEDVHLDGFDSLDEKEDEEKPHDAKTGLSNEPSIAAQQKTHIDESIKKAKQAEASSTATASTDDDNVVNKGVIYIGRIPHGFYEAQLRTYFSQFGEIKQLRLSRNKKTGASKHYGFIQFVAPEVADVVADTMDNYLIFGHILKVKVMQPADIKPGMWKGHDTKYTPVDNKARVLKSLGEPKTKEFWNKVEERRAAKQAKREQKFKNLGIDYKYETAVVEKKTEKKTPKKAGKVTKSTPTKSTPKKKVSKK